MGETVTEKKAVPGVNALTIVGLGLMGGSLARALHPFDGRLTAVDPDPATRAAALAAGVVDVATDRLADGVAGADLVILATPVRLILKVVAQLPALRPDGCAVLDLGSTKQDVVAAMAALPPTFAALGGHPLCGRERSGWTATDSELYRGQPFVLCRLNRTTTAVEQMVEGVLAAIGARPAYLPADVHDRLLAVSSHLPYLLAATLVTVGGEGRPPAWTASAGGFRDMTRLAASDPTMMADIFATNRTAVGAALEEYIARLTAVAATLQGEDDVRLHTLLTAAQAHYDAYQAALAIRISTEN